MFSVRHVSLSTMLPFAAILRLVSAANNLTTNSPADMDTILQESQYLVLSYTNMTIIDAIALKDQIHILVDEIHYEPEGTFGTEIAELSLRAHIFFQADNLTDPDWPPEYIPVVPIEDETTAAMPWIPGSLDKRFEDDKSEDEYYVLALYEDLNCQGMSHVGIKLRRYSCYTITQTEIRSALVVSYARPSYFEIHYEECTSPVKQRTNWPKGRTTMCYKLRTGNSFNWGVHLQTGFGLIFMGVAS